jgi:hypothetical protein
MGLDPEADATYELLEPGLTRRQFVQTQTYLQMLDMLDGFYASQKLHGHTYSGDSIRARYYGLERLLEYQVPTFLDMYKKEGVPESVKGTVIERQAELIIQMAQSGLLEKEKRIAANAVAMEHFRTASAYARHMEADKKGENHFRFSREGKSAAEHALKAIDAAKEYYVPAEIPTENASSAGWGWDKKGPKVQFNRAAAQTLQDRFVLRLSGLKFENALQWQDKGAFVLDSSGSGHGAMTMPMQEILTELQAAKFDIKDPSTYTRMGTDIETFWKAYERERTEVSGDDKYKLIRPKFTR